MRLVLWALVVVCLTGAVAVHRVDPRQAEWTWAAAIEARDHAGGPLNAGLLTGWRAAELVDSSIRNTHGLAGATGCDDQGNPAIEPPRPELTGYERAENIRHETMHRAQFAINCDSIAALWAAEPIYRIQLEAQATCVGLEAWPTDSLRRIRKGLAAGRISAAYGNGSGFEEIYEALDHYCGEKR
jgi:hypothetical protein